MRKQIFQAVRGVLLALVLIELLLIGGGQVDWLGGWLSAFAAVPAAVILLLCLYLTWIRKARGGRTEYLVTMAPGAYGYIGGIFDREKMGNPARVPGGWLTGVRTYRAEDGSLLFTVRRPGGGSLLVRTVVAVVLAVVLLGPLSALSYLDAANTAVSGWLGYDTTPVLSNTSNLITQNSVHTETHTQQDSPDTPTQQDNTESGWKDTVSGWFTGAADWVSGLFGDDDENYILPSHKRELDESDIEGMDAAQLQRAINEIYARYGCVFGSSADKEYFEAQDWYTPDPDMTLDKAQAQFSEIENKNVSFLAARRNALRDKGAMQ